MSKDHSYKNKEELFRQYLDGELGAEEEQKVLHLIADDPDLREMLRFERSLYLNLHESTPDRLEIPDNFADSVMQRIEAGQTSEQPEQISVLDKIKNAAATIFQPRQVSFRPAWGAAAALLIAAILFLPDPELIDESELAVSGETESVQPQLVAEQEVEQEIWIRFIYFDDSANEVAIAGDFSDWEPIELNREYAGDKQVWTGMVPVTRGEHRYMFVKDGEEWVTDPLAEVQRDDGFGNKNAVIYL